MNTGIFDPDLRANPFPRFRALREEHPIVWDDSIPGGAWVVSRYADVLRGLRDGRLSGDRMPLFRLVLRDTDEARAFDDSLQRWLLNLDAPRHTKLRALVSKAFGARIVEALRPRIQTITDGLLDAVEPSGTMDVIRDFALPLPVTIIAELLGLPVSDVPQLRQWSADVAYFFGAMRGVKKAMASDAAMRGYLAEMIAERRKRPNADFLSALLTTEENGEKLADADVVSTCILLFIAGHETTTNLIGNGLLALLEEPDQLALVREDSKHVPGAIEELLRFTAITPFVGRVARDDLELGGQRIENGQFVILVLGGANRDPDVFPNPERLDVLRGENRHLAFGMGMHYCLGAPLARAEGAVAFETLLRRWPRLRLGAEAPVWQANVGLRSLASFPVAFD
jgi:cytochrome P450